MRISIWLVATVTFAAVAEAQADGWYVFAGVGPSYTEDVSGSVGSVPLREGYGTGFMGHGGTGYQVGPYRLEGEIAYAQLPVDQVTLGGIQGASGGDRSTLAGLANFYVDFDTTTRWVPYAGAGIGAANIGLNNISASPTVVLDDSNTVFVFQLKGGVAYTVSPSTQVSVGYRFFSADDPELKDINGLEVSSEGSQLHTLEAGLRYRF
ncbi:MAG: outer membrane beta-barrel protein [Gammaproteobacteria bacterium]